MILGYVMSEIITENDRRFLRWPHKYILFSSFQNNKRQLGRNSWGLFHKHQRDKYQIRQLDHTFMYT